MQEAKQVLKKKKNPSEESSKWTSSTVALVIVTG